MNLVLLAALLIGMALPLTALSGEGKAFAVRPAPQQEYPKIVIYSASWCPHCRRAIQYFTSRGIPYTVKDIETDDAARKELAEKYHTQGIPLITIGDEPIILRGFNPERVEKALATVKN